MLNFNYYIFNERIKPYVGLGIGTIWGRYDYSLSTEESTEEYYLRDFEGQSGWRFGLNRLETQYTINLGLTYTRIID